MIFHDRKYAGKKLAEKLEKYKQSNAIILALPRGGVPVAAEIATVLKSPLEVLIVRKIGAPFYSELAVGAICEEEEPIWNQAILYQLGLATNDLSRIVTAEREKIKNQIKIFRKSQKLSSISKKTVIIVDDGLATGATMSAAVKFLKKKGAAKIVIAVPVAAKRSSAKLRNKVDEVVALEEREDLISVGQWYKDFTQVTDQEVVELLEKHLEPGAEDAPGTKDAKGSTYNLGV